MPKRTATINHPTSSTGNADKVVEQESVEEEKKNDPSDLRDLIFLGKCQKEVSFKGYTFALETLTTDSQRKLLRRVMDIDDVGRVLELKPTTLAYVVTHVNGVPLESLYDGDDDSLEIEEKRIHVLLKMQANLIEALHKEYEDLVKTANDSFDIDDLKA
tara:strand:- start:749 stop:1225 length:477 start_codon:yes stop_codon:yes gene_type:complete